MADERPRGDCHGQVTDESVKVVTRADATLPARLCEDARQVRLNIGLAAGPDSPPAMPRSITPAPARAAGR